MELGYHLSSEEHPAPDLVGQARRAEEVGFDYAVISDHFHPWTHRQGQSPFVWAVLGAIAQVTKRLRLGTVTAPIRRTLPHIVAHAAATVATLLPGRFFLGVGSGENLNEHVTGEWLPPSDVRREMLEEAVEVIRKLWGRIVCGANPERHLTRIGEFVQAGFDHVHVHQVGADQETFFYFYEREVLPRVSEL